MPDKYNDKAILHHGKGKMEFFVIGDSFIIMLLQIDLTIWNDFLLLRYFIGIKLQVDRVGLTFYRCDQNIIHNQDEYDRNKQYFIFLPRF